MEQLICAAIIVGIVAGLALAIRGIEVTRLRNALRLATDRASACDTANKNLRAQLDDYDEVLQRQEIEISQLTVRARNAEQGERAADVEVERLVKLLVGAGIDKRTGGPAVRDYQADALTALGGPGTVAVTLVTPSGERVIDEIPAETLAVAAEQEWIEHDGKPCRLPVGTEVEYQRRDGKVMEYTVSEDSLTEATCWHHDGVITEWDIMRYRILKPAVIGDGQ